MNEGSGSTRISIRLADGTYFPIFLHGDPDTRNVSLVPATEGQDEADIHFYYHSSDGAAPESIGVVRFPDLPVDSGEIELQLDAVIGLTGLLSVSIRHIDTGRVERLEMKLPEDGELISSSAVSSSGEQGSGRFRWLFAVLFVAAGLALVFWFTMMVTNWGRQDPLPPPVSCEFTYSSESAAV
ncbi:MAG: hypothetical protein KAH21_07355 [Spirochaetaceae bacterium]|nr:hypothetical protein [Spirochaetaceae bacterium]